MLLRPVDSDADDATLAAVGPSVGTQTDPREGVSTGTDDGESDERERATAGRDR